MRSVRVIIFFLVLLIAAFLSLAGRCFYLQFFRNDHYAGLCVRQRLGLMTEKPQRGVILDCRGRVFAASNEVQTIFAEPRAIGDPQNTSLELASVLNMDADAICGLITGSGNPGFAAIREATDRQQCLDACRIYGIGVQSDWRRQ
jgi:cell division protein FtsI/penicillin-binding protein 2